MHQPLNNPQIKSFLEYLKLENGRSAENPDEGNISLGTKWQDFTIDHGLVAKADELDPESSAYVLTDTGVLAIDLLSGMLELLDEILELSDESAA